MKKITLILLSVFITGFLMAQEPSAVVLLQAITAARQRFYMHK